MRAVVLAAGQHAAADGPIGNLEVSGRRLIDFQVAALRSAGAAEIVVVAGHRAAELRRADVRVVENRAWRDTGSAESLALAAEAFDGAEDVLVVYGDTLFSPDALAAVTHGPGPLAALCLLDRQGRDLGHFREYALIENGKLRHVAPADSAASVRTVFTGALFVRAELAAVVRNYLDERLFPPKSHLGELVNALLRHGAGPIPVLVERGWAEIRNADQYAALLSDPHLSADLLPVHVDWTSRAKRYDRLAWVNDDRLLSAIVDLAEDRRPARVLDLGTGTGKVLLAIRSALGTGEYWGVDSSEAMLARVPERAGLTLRCDDAERLEETPSRHFDMVTARMMFHHLQNPQSAVAAAARVLKPAGLFVICEGVPPSLRTAKWYTEMFRYKEDRRTLTEVDLIELMVRGGFEDVTTRTVVMRDASLNNWLDNSGVPEENIRKIKELHFEAPDYVRQDYDMRFAGGDCLMTWRFAVVHGRAP
jgi:ubiquinone/menaquinone biosynthesis C-methylase UbiE/choline kinase